MNRRGFIALATAAAVAPQELIRAPGPVASVLMPLPFEPPSEVLAQVLTDLASYGSAVTRVHRGIMSAVAFREVLQPILQEEFEKVYAERENDWERIFSGKFDDQEIPWWEKASASPEDVTVEPRRANLLHNPVDAVESTRPDLRELG